MADSDVKPKQTKRECDDTPQQTGKANQKKSDNMPCDASIFSNIIIPIIIAVIGFLTLCAICVQAIIYACQLVEMRKSTNAATKAANAAEDSVLLARENSHLDQRAWAAVANIAGVPEIGHPYLVTVSVANTGKTFAKKFRFIPILDPQDGDAGAKADRAQLSEALDFARQNDTIVVWKLDRLGRSLKHLIDTVNDLHKRKIGFRSLQENLDTTSPSGKLFFHIIGALAEFERDIIRERTNAGLMAARARGRLGGRPRLLNGKKIQMAKALLSDHRNNIKDVCSTLGVSRSTLYRYADQNDR